MLKFASKKKLRKFVKTYLFESVETSGYDLTDFGALIGRGAANVKDYRIKISDDVSDKNLEKTNQDLINIVLNFATWLEENYPNSPVPIITSGNRTPAAQANALLVKHEKDDDIFDLYVNQCFSCARHMGGQEKAKKNMNKVMEILDNNALNHDQKEELLIRLLEKKPISLHMSGLAVDMGAQPDLLDRLLKFVNTSGLEDYLEIIEETKPPHIHIGYLR